MSTSNEDRELRSTNMEESNLNTIEFLRARLLSERAISKTARQRADELAKRVLELEEQLEFVTLQRKKAEKATVDVLAILENLGISDRSEEFDSCSEQGETSEESKPHSGSLTSKETSTNVKSRKNEKEAYSSSEIESSPSTGRSLSWRSTKDSHHSLEKKKYMDSIRRRASFSSNSSSARRAGKSCRRIRHRETRSMSELQNDGDEKATNSGNASNCTSCEPDAVVESSTYANGKGQPGIPTSGPPGGAQKVSGHCFSIHDRDEDMESALQHQAQLIGQFEEEEKAQREWEEKFRETNHGTQQDSCDHGNHSDITDEQYETKSPELPCVAGTIDSDNPETKQESANARLGDEPQTSKSLPSVTNTDKEHLQNNEYSTCINAHESSASEFSFPTSRKSDQELSRTLQEASTHRCEQIPPMVSMISYGDKTTTLSASSGSPSSFKLAVAPQETSNSLGSVLEALQQAKLSLNEKLGSFSQIAGGTSSNVINPSNPETSKVNGFLIPFATPGLFRLPTDYQFEATARANPGINLQRSFSNYPPEITSDRFQFEATARANPGINLQRSFSNYPPEITSDGFHSEPFVGSRSAFSHDMFLSVPPEPLLKKQGMELLHRGQALSANFG